MRPTDGLERTAAVSPSFSRDPKGGAKRQRVRGDHRPVVRAAEETQRTSAMGGTRTFIAGGLQAASPSLPERG